MKQFSDFAEEQVGLEGEKLRLDDIINCEMVVSGYRVNDSKYNHGHCLTIQFCYPEKPEEKFILFTGSGVLTSQMEKYGHEIPFMATIRKVERYYTLT